MLMLFEFLYPDSRLFSVYDNATIHRAKGAHALDASIMNLSPGGKQRKQRATTYTNLKTGARGVKQSLVDEHGVAKGLLAILLGCLRFCWSVANNGPRPRRRSWPWPC